jgi:glycosyltransferase involved in cell wall biosynthesis
LIRQHGVDVVHTNSLKAGFYGCLAARLSRVPAVWHLRDRLASDYLPPFALALTRLALLVLPKTIICNSESTLETIDWPWPRRRLLTAIVAASPIPDVLESSAMSRRLGAALQPHRAFTIAMVGRITPWKGQLVVVRAFSEARLPESAVLVLMGSPMFGEDDYLAEIEQEVARRGLTERVQLRGFVSDVLSALSEVDVLVHASTSPEPFGQVIVEGMAVGVPVVATRGGGPSEIITDGVDGLLYEAGDAARLAELLTVLHEDATLRDRLRNNGLMRARDFTPGMIAPRVYEQYVRVAGK